MKEAYPIVVTQGNEWMVVYVPDFEINTEGKDLADAMEMARDAIGLVGITLEDEGKELPHPSALSDILAASEGRIVTMVDVDFAEYRRMNDMRSVCRNISLPQRLDTQAE